VRGCRWRTRHVSQELCASSNMPSRHKSPDVRVLLTARMTTQGAAGQPAVLRRTGIRSESSEVSGLCTRAEPPRHIDVLQNQIAFVIGKNLDAVGLVKALFPSMTGTPPTGTASFDMKNGNDGASRLPRTTMRH